jgi:hypothetical protein
MSLRGKVGTYQAYEHDGSHDGVDWKYNRLNVREVQHEGRLREQRYQQECRQICHLQEKRGSGQIESQENCAISYVFSHVAHEAVKQPDGFDDTPYEDHRYRHSLLIVLILLLKVM